MKDDVLLIVLFLLAVAMTFATVQHVKTRRADACVSRGGIPFVDEDGRFTCTWPMPRSD